MSVWEILITLTSGSSLYIAPREILPHSPQFTSAAASEAGINGLLDAAKALAMTVVDLLANPEIVIKVKEEFVKNK